MLPERRGAIFQRQIMSNDGRGNVKSSIPISEIMPSEEGDARTHKQNIRSIDKYLCTDNYQLNGVYRKDG